MSVGFYKEDDKGREVKVYGEIFTPDKELKNVGKWHIGELGDGVFIGWNQTYESAAIVMNDDGRVRRVFTRYIQFLKPDNEEKS